MEMMITMINDNINYDDNDGIFSEFYNILGKQRYFKTKGDGVRTRSCHRPNARRRTAPARGSEIGHLDDVGQKVS
jgi:hypothetical protein